MSRLTCPSCGSKDVFRALRSDWYACMECGQELHDGVVEAADPSSPTALLGILCREYRISPQDPMIVAMLAVMASMEAP